MNDGQREERKCRCNIVNFFSIILVLKFFLTFKFHATFIHHTKATNDECIIGLSFTILTSPTSTFLQHTFGTINTNVYLAFERPLIYYRFTSWPVARKHSIALLCV